MKSITIVVAVGNNNVIGNSQTNNLPGWKLPGDLKNFSLITRGHITGSGRKTYESFPVKYRPLPERVNTIISRNFEYVPYPSDEQTNVCSSLEEALTAMDIIFPEKTFFLIGGGELYAYALSHPDIIIDEIILTQVHGDFEGDVFFPELPEDKWRLVSAEPFQKDERNSHDYTIKRYVPVS